MNKMKTKKSRNTRSPKERCNHCHKKFNAFTVVKGLCGRCRKVGGLE